MSQHIKAETQLETKQSQPASENLFIGTVCDVIKQDETYIERFKNELRCAFAAQECCYSTLTADDVILRNGSQANR